MPPPHPRRRPRLAADTGGEVINCLIESLLQSGPRGSAIGLETILLTMLVAFVLGQLVAWAYVWTHLGISYSRTFTQSLVLITMVVALVMLAIGDSIVTAFGLLGALAIVRFRNVLKDTRDTVVVFLAIVQGMAIGVQHYQTAAVGTALILLVMAYLYGSAFGSLGNFDGHLSCWIHPGGEGAASLQAVLERYCARTRQMSCRRGGEGDLVEYVYQIHLRDRRRYEEMLESLRDLPAVEDAAFVIRDRLAEI